MATRESLAIREEQAQARIAKATRAIADSTGVTIPPIQATEKDPYARNASLAEQTADALESIAAIVAPEPEDDSDDDQEPKDGNDNTGSGGDNTAQPPTEPIKRSQASRKRQ